jgi:hypothetical protein
MLPTITQVKNFRDRTPCETETVTDTDTEPWSIIKDTRFGLGIGHGLGLARSSVSKNLKLSTLYF